MGEAIYEKEITLREKMAFMVLYMMLVIVKPTSYTHEYQKEWDELKKMLFGIK